MPPGFPYDAHSEEILPRLGTRGTRGHHVTLVFARVAAGTGALKTGITRRLSPPAPSHAAGIPFRSSGGAGRSVCAGGRDAERRGSDYLGAGNAGVMGVGTVTTFPGFPTWRHAEGGAGKSRELAVQAPPLFEH